MDLTIINKTDSTKNYLGGIVSVSANSSTTIPRDLNVVITNDASLLSDIISRSVALSNGSTDEFSGPQAIDLLRVLANFLTDPIATLFLYYAAPVNVRQTAATASGNTVWAMRNPTSATFFVVIERIFLQMSFDAATPLVGVNLQRYELVRFSGGDPSGGTSITAVKSSSSAPNSGVVAQFLDTGLTMTGVSFGTPLANISCPEVQGSTNFYQRSGACLKLAAGEGLAIRISDIAAAVGQSIVGEVIWSLR